MIRKNLRNALIVITLILVSYVNAEASILLGEVTGGRAFTKGGTFVVLDPPISVVDRNNLQSFNLWGFDEDQAVLLNSPLEVNQGYGIGDFVPTGTLVSSHYVIFDPKGYTRMIGYVEFDNDILGVMTKRKTLLASDFLGHDSVFYINSSLRGLEGGNRVWVEENNPRRLYINTTASSPGDWVRVITGAVEPTDSAVPEPTSLLLFGLGASALGIARRKFKK